MFRYNRVLNRSILITGSTKGLGNCLAKKFIENDTYDTIYIHGSSTNTVNNALSEIGKEYCISKQKNIIGIACDFGLGNNQDDISITLTCLTDDNYIKVGNFKQFFKQYPIDDLVLNHAISQEKLFIKLKNNEINKILNINIISVLQLANIVLNAWMRGRTKHTKTLTTVGSILNDFQEPKIKGNSIYAMSKKNIEILSQYLHLEYGKQFPWLKVLHYNPPLLSDSSLVTDKTLLEKVGVEHDSIGNVADKIYKQIIGNNALHTR